MVWYARRESWSAQAEDARDVGDVDYARVIHSASFRRLQGKTQILNLGDNDFYRTRLTHSMEVAQIASGLVKQLGRSFPDHPATPHLPERAQIQAIACSHDLGHPPFGHGGEVALNYCMRGAGGFEGNGQTLRLLSRLEDFSHSAGANLSRRSLLGVLKYPAPFSQTNNAQLAPGMHAGTSARFILDASASVPPKCYLDCESSVVDWILDPLSKEDRQRFTATRSRVNKHAQTLHKSLDCSIMDVADDIAYGVHDLEDAIALNLVSAARFREVVTPKAAEAFTQALREKYPDESNDPYERMVEQLFHPQGQRKRYISRLVHHFITHMSYSEDRNFAEPLLRYRATLSPETALFLAALKTFIMDELICGPVVQQLEFKGQDMVISVFEALSTEPRRLLPERLRTRIDQGDTPLQRLVCDFVAAMTDTSLLQTYERLFAPRMGSIFDRV